ncbi:hypothetical protein B0H19DRAFT_1266168 [Mycena capillaripes]|nr:hypothetical protein B0H19DRAFT_1266168 [Mycena capillaripes]
MAPSDDKSGDGGDDLLDSPTQGSFQISATHMYTFSSTSHSVRSKRRQRKERKKGAKRGPYKKRDGKGNIIAQSKEPPLGSEFDASPQPSGSAPPTTVFAGSIPVGYPPGFYAHALPPGHKPGEAVYYSQFYLAPVPPHAGQEGERSSHPPRFFPATFMTAYAQPYPPYIVPDGQMHHAGAPAGSAAANVEPSGADDDEENQSDVPQKN